MKKRICIMILAGCMAASGCGGNREAKAQESATEAAGAGYTASDYIVLGDYRNLVLTDEDVKVPQEDIDAEISGILEEYREAEEITDRGAMEGDVVNITSKGYDEGEEVETLRAYSFDLMLGSGSFGKEYEDQLLGVGSGETKEFDITYPDDYASENLAGKTIHYVVTVHMIVRYEDQELTDDYVAELTDSEYTTVEAFRQGCADMLMEENREKYALRAAKKKILESSEIQGYPEKTLNETIEELEEFYSGGAEYLDMELEEYLELATGNSGQDGEQSIQKLAEGILAEEMMMKAIAEQEQITLSEGEYQSYGEEYLEDQPELTLEELEETFGKEELQAAFTLKKTEEFLAGLIASEG